MTLFLLLLKLNMQKKQHSLIHGCCNSTFLSNCWADNIIYEENLCKGMQNASIFSVDFCTSLYVQYVLFTNTRMSLESLLLCMKIINYKTNRFKGKSHLARRELISPNIKGRATLMCFHSLSPNKNSPHFTSITTKKQLKFKKT